jgi:hypothetical protein
MEDALWSQGIEIGLTQEKRDMNSRQIMVTESGLRRKCELAGMKSINIEI